MPTLKMNGHDMLYISDVIRGALLLAKVNPQDIEEIIMNADTLIRSKEISTFKQLDNYILDNLKPKEKNAYQIIVDFKNARANNAIDEPIILILGGASGTGKSIITSAMAYRLTSTRIMGTDTLRQVLRAQLSKEQVPELYCHTYQAYKYLKKLDPNQDPIIQGYIAQSKIVMGSVKSYIERIISEGTTAILEGVHIIPGELGEIERKDNIIEYIVHPPYELHRSMFIGKSVRGELKTVSRNISVREEEFKVARKIQDYIVELAQKVGTHVLEFSDFDKAVAEVSNTVIDRMNKMLSKQ